MTYSDHYDNQIAFLEHFFDTVKNNSLLYLSSDLLCQMRTRIRSTLNDLLVWGRPHLLRTRGLQWPYDECALIAPDLEKVYQQNTDKSAQKQALLFLSFLPVPNQWRWLSKAIDTLVDDPEINHFLITERQTIQSKLTAKSQSTFKLRHFVQILKSPRLPHEKGVLRIFSLPYLFLDKQLLKKIADHYVFFVEPPMGVVFRHAWWRLFTELEDPCIFGLGGEEDRHFIDMQFNTHVIPLAHGDFLQDVDHLGLTDRVTVLSNLRRQDLPLHLARCKAGVHLSLYENACRCIYEYFRADIPCVISSVTAGMDMTIFNPETGQVGHDDQLPEIIAHVLNHHSSYSPRKWFLNHSGSQHASRKLNENLADFFAGNGYLWQNNIVPLDSSGATRYLKKDHYRQFLPEFHQLLAWLKQSIATSINLTVDEM